MEEYHLGHQTIKLLQNGNKTTLPNGRVSTPTLGLQGNQEDKEGIKKRS